MKEICICYCKHCKKFVFKEVESNTETILCHSCSNPMTNTEYTKEYYESLSDYGREELRDRIISEIESESDEKEIYDSASYKKDKLKEIRGGIGRNKEEKIKYDIDSRKRVAKVSTGGLDGCYEVIGPVFFEINNADGGKVFQEFCNKYRKEISDMYSLGIDSSCKSTAEIATIVLNALNEDAFSEQSNQSFFDLGVNTYRNFDVAFLIAVEELKLRAVQMGCSGVINMRYNFNLDTNERKRFYLQMYGTAVKYESYEYSDYEKIAKTILEY